MSQLFWWMIFKLALCLEPSNTDKPLASDHLKCQALMGRSLMGVGCSRDKVTDWLFWMLKYSLKSQFWEKVWEFPLRNFCLLCYPGMRYTLLFNFCSIICPVVAYRMLKRKENFKFLALKVVTVAYKRWSLACVASVSRRFGSKELQGVLFWLSQHFPCRQNTKNPVPWSFFAAKPNGNAYNADYK